MVIKRVSVGNGAEAYIEERFDNGFNIISSDDNNKGKTIVIQSMMYALGNEPIFPSSFFFKDYYHTVEFVIDDNDCNICRKGNSFVVVFKEAINIFDNLSEFKHYMNRAVFTFPTIIKDGQKKLVDPLLFYQLFFIGQDKKNTSNIILNSYYNKNDFINMVYQLYEIPLKVDGDNEEIKEILKSLRVKKKEILKKNKILKSSFGAVQLVSMENDRIKFSEKLSKVGKIKDRIVELNSNRNNLTARKLKNEVVLRELRSLNQTMMVGKIQCLDCGSDSIGYSTADKSYTFDVSSIDNRNHILGSIEDKINAYNEEIQFVTSEINSTQLQLKNALKDDEITIESLLIHKQELLDAEEADNRLSEIDNEINKYEKLINVVEEEDNEIKKQKTELLESIVEEMNSFYKYIDEEAVDSYSGLFTVKNQVYSGVEGTEFYLAKLYALLVVLKHQFPIVMDSFRASELSSKKEQKVIEKFKEVKNQVIFTVTLKDEELGKYNNVESINNIDYVDHKAYNLLSEEYVNEFWEYNKRFLIKR